jgi:hypothetical protein
MAWPVIECGLKTLDYEVGDNVIAGSMGRKNDVALASEAARSFLVYTTVLT